MASNACGGRDNISIAFTRSQYATPYSDQTIPGSTPGHRLRQLGRQHQPLDILYNHLNHALVAQGDGGGYDSTATAAHPAPPGGNYVLHSKNGGKRHYEELSGVGSELPWHPSLRPLIPPSDDDEGHRQAPQRRGRGVYNLDDDRIHPDAEAALRQRAMAEERRRDHGGKARVSGPLDHSMAELGMSQQQQQLQAATRSRGSSSAAAPRASATSHALPGSAANADGGRSGAARASRVVEDDSVETRAYNGKALLASTGYGVPPARGTAAEADAVADFHRDQRMRCVLDLRKETTSASATRAVDAQAVRELPNW